jgi:hypothetical protein
MLWIELLFSYFPIEKAVLWKQMLARLAFLFAIWLSGLIVYTIDGLMIEYVFDMNVYLGYFVTSFIILFGSYFVQQKLSNIIQDFRPILKLNNLEFEKLSNRLKRIFYNFFPCLILAIALGILTGVSDQFQAVLIEGFKLNIIWNILFNSFGLLLTATAIWMFVSIWITIYLISRQPLNVKLSPETIARFRELTVLALWFSMFYFIGISISNFPFFTSGQAFSITEILLSPYLFFIAIGVFGVLFPFYNIHLTLLRLKKEEIVKISKESQELLVQIDRKLADQPNLQRIDPSVSIMHHRLFNLQVKEKYVKAAQEWPIDMSFLSKLLVLVLIPIMSRITFMLIFS